MLCTGGDASAYVGSVACICLEAVPLVFEGGKTSPLVISVAAWPYHDAIYLNTVMSHARQQYARTELSDQEKTDSMWQ